MKAILISFLSVARLMEATTLWPAPQSASSGPSTLIVSPSQSSFFGMKGGVAPCNTLAQAFARYESLTFPHPASAVLGSDSILKGIIVVVDNLDESHPQLGTDESYTLTVPADGTSATLTAPTVYGALRGLETFSQLVVFDFDAAGYVIEGAPWVITDAPRFPHRGLMIDSARHYLPLSAIEAAIDSLSYAKLNVRTKTNPAPAFLALFPLPNPALQRFSTFRCISDFILILRIVVDPGAALAHGGHPKLPLPS